MNSDLRMLKEKYEGWDEYEVDMTILQHQINNFTLVHRRMIHVGRDRKGKITLVLGGKPSGV